ncbi:hypothetical protein DFJ58DRAFT_849901 [Suillus subalutaceus]|uniref:uncharacterized protein n=1 Tax=Suillus subalutaceus TaxID=48586 RepID=UPI001B872F5E|nr:uncharacterized protein DFJ58DRAFT_849901 [Suillus subalutaceus]KAG1822238.1 hypothetical protein DFJ58DRAFT_849901 [Suillus subalutaceus]
MTKIKQSQQDHRSDNNTAEIKQYESKKKAKIKQNQGEMKRDPVLGPRVTPDKRYDEQDYDSDKTPEIKESQAIEHQKITKIKQNAVKSKRDPVLGPRITPKTRPPQQHHSKNQATPQQQNVKNQAKIKSSQSKVPS